MPRKMKVIKTEKRMVGGREREVVSAAFVDEEREAKRAKRFFRIPWDFIERSFKGAPYSPTTLPVALLIYRRAYMQNSQEPRGQKITLLKEELADFGIDGRRAERALVRLQTVGLIRAEVASKGQKTVITLL